MLPILNTGIIVPTTGTTVSLALAQEVRDTGTTARLALDATLPILPGEMMAVDAKAAALVDQYVAEGRPANWNRTAASALYLPA